MFLRQAQGKRKCLLNKGNTYNFDDNIRKTLLDDISLSRYSKEDVVLPFKAGKNVRHKYAVYFYENTH